MTLRRAALAAAATVLATAAGLALRTGMFGDSPEPPPQPSLGDAVVQSCPPLGDAYFAFSPRVKQAAIVPSFEPDRYAAVLLRTADASPLWCGNRDDAAYRFLLLVQWGKTTIVTARRLSAGWVVDGVEFKHSEVAPLEVERRVSRRLSDAEGASVVQMFEVIDFWNLDSHESEQDCCDAPTWVLEARSRSGYYAVVRAWERRQIMRPAERLMELAGFKVPEF